MSEEVKAAYDEESFSAAENAAVSSELISLQKMLGVGDTQNAIPMYAAAVKGMLQKYESRGAKPPMALVEASRLAEFAVACHKEVAAVTGVPRRTGSLLRAGAKPA